MAESDLELVTMAANLNAETVREQQQEIVRLMSENRRLRSALERSAQAMNSIRAYVEGTLWPNSGLAPPEKSNG